jgi:hypothetical protein
VAVGKGPIVVQDACPDGYPDVQEGLGWWWCMRKMRGGTVVSHGLGK